jgi:hypothetical protein
MGNQMIHHGILSDSVQEGGRGEMARVLRPVH